MRPPSHLLGPACTGSRSSAPFRRRLTPGVPGPVRTTAEARGVGIVARTQSRCGALTQKGTRCQRLAMENASRCNLHRGDWSTYTIKKRKEAEEKAKARKRRK
ncbi:HGGxSTG domain-containing protein [Streptomyces sp. ISL-1]|uniref:HGGxSTG domain-containing protein n=1 Tax=Streptomyces sp. ISL-1 TaxID=2817657 RepID=UPI0035ABC4AF